MKSGFVTNINYSGFKNCLQEHTSRSCRTKWKGGGGWWSWLICPFLKRDHNTQMPLCN